jgi:hypothetical protein
MLSVVNEYFMLSVGLLNAIMLNVIMLNVVMLNVIMLNVVMLNVVMLKVIKLSVVAPCLQVWNTSAFNVESWIYDRNFFTVQSWEEKKKEQDSLNHWINRKGQGKSTKRKRNRNRKRNRKRKRNRRQRQYGLFFFKNAAEPESLFRGEMSTRSLLPPPVLPRWATTKNWQKKIFFWQIVFF